MRNLIFWGVAWFAVADVLAAPNGLVTSAKALPPVPGVSQSNAADWLVTPTPLKAGIYRGASDQDVILDNGLIRRSFRLQPNAATVAFDNLMTGASLLRAVKPEAIASLDGKSYDIGGLVGQPQQGYLLPEWIDAMKAAPGGFQCVGFEVGTVQAPFEWRRKRHAADLPWPPPIG